MSILGNFGTKAILFGVEKDDLVGMGLTLGCGSGNCLVAGKFVLCLLKALLFSGSLLLFKVDLVFVGGWAGRTP